MSTAWITHPVIRSHGLPVKMEGMLEEASTKRLIKLYNTYSPKEMVLTQRETSRGGVAAPESRVVVESMAAKMAKMRLATGGRREMVGRKATGFTGSAVGSAWGRAR